MPLERQHRKLLTIQEIAPPQTARNNRLYSSISTRSLHMSGSIEYFPILRHTRPFARVSMGEWLDIQLVSPRRGNRDAAEKESTIIPAEPA
jgi:hypothetical protein